MNNQIICLFLALQAPVHFTQVCANFRPSIQLQLCCQRSDSEVYSWTGMLSLKTERNAASIGLLSYKTLS